MGKHDNQFDFFEDENPAYSALNVTTNTMDLYLDKIDQYLQHFKKIQNNHPDETMNMYLYLGVQTLHGPYTRVMDKTATCKAILDSSGESNSIRRLRLCEYTLLTDDWMKYLVTALQTAGLWDDTLLIFTGDNGADIDEGSCNYPLRGMFRVRVSTLYVYYNHVPQINNLIIRSNRSTINI